MRLHATCVAIERRGLLILGASGSGKSALALELLALGAELVSDDQTLVDLVDGHLIASPPETIRGAIEARGVGLLAATYAGPTPITLAVDLDRIETERLPVDRTISLLGRDVSLLHKLDRPYFPAALLQYMKAGKARL